MIFIPYSRGVCDPELALAEMGVESGDGGDGVWRAHPSAAPAAEPG